MADVQPEVGKWWLYYRTPEGASSVVNLSTTSLEDAIEKLRDLVEAYEAKGGDMRRISVRLREKSPGYDDWDLVQRIDLVHGWVPAVKDIQVLFDSFLVPARKV